MISKFYI